MRIRYFVNSLFYSHTYFAFDVGVWVVALELEVVVGEVENVFFIRVDKHSRQRSWVASELQPALVDVVVVDMGIA